MSETGQEGAPAAAPRRNRARAGRAAAAVAVIGLLGVAVPAAAWIPLGEEAAPEALVVQPSPAEERLTCPGPLLRLADPSGVDTRTVAAVEGPAVTYGGAPALAERPLSAPLAGSPARPLVVTVPPGAPAETDSAAAAQSQFGAEGLNGFAAAACGRPAGDQWIVGGAADPGRTSFLLLANPTDVGATVDLTITGEDGPVVAPGASGISVPAGSQVVVPLSAFAPDVASPVVRVTSRGGQVVATLQETIVRGIEPGGVEVTGATAPPALTQVVPGVRVSGAENLQRRIAEEGFGDLQSVLRVLAPGDGEGELTVAVRPDDPLVAGTSFALHVHGDQVVDIPLDGLVDGSYTVTVQSELEVVAAVRQSQVAADGVSDLAWLPAPAEFSGVAGAAIAPGPQPRLYLAAGAEAAVHVELTWPDGAIQPIDVAPSTTVWLDVIPAAVYRIASSGPLRASVAYADEGAVSGYPVLVPSPAAAALEIYP